MPWYGDWVTPEPKETYVGAELATRVTFNRGISSGWDVEDQNATLDPPSPADFSSTSSSASRSYGSVSHIEADHPAGGSTDSVGGRMEFLKSRPVALSYLGSAPDDMQGADYFEQDDSGYVIDYLARIVGYGNPVSFSSGVEFGQPWENHGSGEVSIRWSVGFDFEPNPVTPTQMLYPGSVWRAWSGHSVDSGESDSVDVSLGTSRDDVTFALIPQRLITPTASPPNTGGPSWVLQAGHADRYFVCQYQPHAYRLVWNDDNPPPWLSTGMWQVRQRQSAAGNAGGLPLRQRQNAGITGAWPLRQR